MKTIITIWLIGTLFTFAYADKLRINKNLEISSIGTFAVSIIAWPYMLGQEAYDLTHKE